MTGAMDRGHIANAIFTPHRNATKPVRIAPLNGLDAFEWVSIEVTYTMFVLTQLLISVAASAYTTYWLVHPNSKSSDLERWPLNIPSPDDCIVCGKDIKNNNPLECEKVSSTLNGSLIFG